jgi:hypothetical protein
LPSLGSTVALRKAARCRLANRQSSSIERAGERSDNPTRSLELDLENKETLSVKNRLALSPFGLAVLAALSCGNVNSAAAQSLAGKWFGSGAQAGGHACWVNERRPDGTYEILFVLAREGTLRRAREEGTWFHANGLYATVTQRINGQPADPKDRRLREVYRVIELTASRVRYADIGSPTEFVAERVPDNFVLSDTCPKKP